MGGKRASQMLVYLDTTAANHALIAAKPAQRALAHRPHLRYIPLPQGSEVHLRSSKRPVLLAMCAAAALAPAVVGVAESIHAMAANAVRQVRLRLLCERLRCRASGIAAWPRCRAAVQGGGVFR